MDMYVVTSTKTQYDNDMICCRSELKAAITGGTDLLVDLDLDLVLTKHFTFR